MAVVLPAVLNTARLAATRHGFVPSNGFLFIGGSDHSADVRRGTTSLTLNLNSTPSTATFHVNRTYKPQVGQDVKIHLGTKNNLLFGGVITAVVEGYDGNIANPSYNVTCQDYTWLLDRRRAMGRYQNAPVETILADLFSRLTSGFTTNHVTFGLGTVTDITFDGSATITQAIAQLAKIVGAKYFIDPTKDLWFFVTRPSTDLQAATPTTLFSLTTDSNLTQIKTRILVKGASAKAQLALTASDTAIPLDSATIFGSASGSAYVNGQILAYTGVTAGGATSVVGNGIPPTATFNRSASGWATNGSSSNANTATPTFTAATYPFVAADIGASVYIASGANALVGSYLITAVSGGNATLSGPIGTTANIGTIGFGVDYSKQTTPRYTFSATLSINAGGTNILNGLPLRSGVVVQDNILGNSVYITAGSGFIVQQVTVDSVSGVSGTCSASLGLVTISGGSGVLGQSINTVVAGSTSLLVTDASGFSAAGGFLSVSGQTIKYTGKSGNTLTGIPASGSGSILSTLTYGAATIALPALTGVSGWSVGLSAGDAVFLWVQVDDTGAQTALAAIEGGDGIHEYPVVDSTIVTAAQATAIGTAYLTLFKNKEQRAQYQSRDTASALGKTITLNFGAPAFEPTAFENTALQTTGTESFATYIQTIRITGIDAVAPGTGAPYLYPAQDVTASTTMFVLANLLRQVTGN